MQPKQGNHNNQHTNINMINLHNWYEFDVWEQTFHNNLSNISDTQINVFDCDF